MIPLLELRRGESSLHHMSAAVLLVFRSKSSAARPGLELRRPSSPPYVCNTLRGAALAVLGGLLPPPDLEVIFIVFVAPSSSRPRGRLRRLRRQRLCGSVIPAFRSTRVCIPISAVLLYLHSIDPGCSKDIVGRNFFVFCMRSPSVVSEPIYRRYSCTLLEPVLCTGAPFLLFATL